MDTDVDLPFDPVTASICDFVNQLANSTSDIIGIFLFTAFIIIGTLGEIPGLTIMMSHSNIKFG